ncbi:MAG TPA: sensor histidine kinase, partial [Vicinamibacteria bacterium]
MLKTGVSRRLRGAALLAAASALACRPASSSAPPLVSIEEASRLPPGREARVRGVLGLYDRASSTAYLQDGAAALFLDTASAPSVPADRRSVEVEGVIEQRGAPPGVPVVSPLVSMMRARRFSLAPAAGPTPAPPQVPAAALDDPALQGRWVAVEGVVTRVDGRPTSHTLHIAGEGASFAACVSESQDRPVGRESILGFRVRAQGVRVAGADTEAVARGCTLRLPTRLFLRLLQDAPLAEAQAAPALVPVAGIRALSPDEARQRRPVRVRGVVTAHDPTRNLLFVQDETAGIYVEAWRHLYDVRPGQTVEVAGWTDRGAFAPIIIWPRLRVVGSADFPRPIRLEAAVLPQHDSQWVEVDGVVRAARLEAGRAVLELMAFGERLQVHVPGITALERVAPLVDARVRARGVYAAAFSRTRQLVGVDLTVPGLERVSVLAPAPMDPYAAPLRRSDSVLEFRPQDDSAHRVHARGVVTLHRPGQFLYLRDAGGPLRVESRDRTPLQAGDEVDVVGFPGVDEFRPSLLDGSYRLRERQPRPSPLPVPAEQAMSGTLQGELVTLEARLIGRLAPEGESRLVLESPLSVFEAVLAEPAAAAFDGLRPGSRVSVTGICVVRGDAARVPQSFQVLLRSPQDVRLLQAAPWWTVRRALLAAGGLVAVAAGALVWVGALRRRVREQTRILRGRLAREAALEERTRLARELHDSLEQDLAGIGYALEAVKHTIDHPSVARSHLDRALMHVDQSMGEARRSVWALRPRALEGGDLVAALETLAHEVTRGGVLDTEVYVHGRRWALAPDVEDQLFRVAQEALTNALKHADARRLRLDLRFAEAALTVVVQDDGRGFDPEAAPAAGHFGLLGMRERVAKV